MKLRRIIMLVVLFLMFIPLIAKAETCKVVKGDGKAIGDEVKCGSESFYVIEAGKTETKLFAKYNLYVGDNISQVEPGTDAPSFDNYYTNQREAARSYCENYVSGFNQEAYTSYPVVNYNDTNSKYEITACRIYVHIKTDHVVQDSRAVGTFLVNGKSKLPLYGITYMVPEWGYEALVNHETHENEYDNDGNLILEDTLFKDYLTGYKTELGRQNIVVENVSFITLDGIKEVLKSISGKEVEMILEPYEAQSAEDEYTVKMDIKTFAGTKYKWLFDSTYWLGSGYYEKDNIDFGLGNFEYNDYFVSNEGFLCAIGRGECTYLPYPIGQGVRPVITVKNTNMEVAGATSSDDAETKEVDPKKEDNPNTSVGKIITSVVLLMFTSACFLIYLSNRKLLTHKNRI